MRQKMTKLGLNAKVALAAMVACGVLFSSCYKKADPIQEGPAPQYFIAGTIIDAATGSAMDNVTLTVNGVSVPVTNGAFKTGNLAYTSVAIPIVATCPDYVTVTKYVYLTQVGNGAIFIGNGSLAMHAEPVVNIHVEFLSAGTAADAAALNTALTDAVLKPTATLTGDKSGAITPGAYTKTTVSTPDNGVVVKYPFTFATKYFGGGNVDFPMYNGILSLGSTVTKATASAEEVKTFMAAVATFLSKEFDTNVSNGIVQDVWEEWLEEFDSDNSVYGYTMNYYWAVQRYKALFNGSTFEGAVGTMPFSIMFPEFFNHTSHDLWHGSGFFAGGGIGYY